MRRGELFLMEYGLTLCLAITRRMTLVEIARLAKVSIGAVSRTVQHVARIARDGLAFCEVNQRGTRSGQLDLVYSLRPLDQPGQYVSKSSSRPIPESEVQLTIQRVQLVVDRFFRLDRIEHLVWRTNLVLCLVNGFERPSCEERKDC